MKMAVNAKDREIIRLKAIVELLKENQETLVERYETRLQVLRDAYNEEVSRLKDELREARRR